MNVNKCIIYLIHVWSISYYKQYSLLNEKWLELKSKSSSVKCVNILGFNRICSGMHPWDGMYGIYENV